MTKKNKISISAARMPQRSAGRRSVGDERCRKNLPRRSRGYLAACGGEGFIFLFALLFAGILIIPKFSLAESCPSITTVSGNTVNFVGELTDMGGESGVSVWFEYGRTVNYGQKTSEKILTQQGFYCISVSDLSSCSTYHYRAGAKNSAGTSYGENKSFTTTCGSISADIKANGSDGSITIPYNNSANLTWNSTNAESCYASGDWSGAKYIFGSQTTGNLISSKTYTLTCTGVFGSAVDSVTVNVSGSAPQGSLYLNKLARNLSDGTNFGDSVLADPNEIISFSIQVKAINDLVQNVVIRDTLSDKIVFFGNLKIDGVSTAGDIISGLNIGNLSANQTKTITFDAKVANSAQFPFGDTYLINTASVSSSSAAASASDTATVTVRKTAVLGATSVSTGLTNNLLVDSFFLPLVFSLIIIFLFRSRIVNFEEWKEKRKKAYNNYKARKELHFKISKIKTKEFSKKF